MTCSNRDIGKLLALYEFDELPEKDKLKFEEHLLSCDECFQNMYSLSPAVDRLRNEPQKFLAVIKKKETVWETSKQKIIDAVGNLRGIPHPFRLAIPSAVVALILLTLFFLPSKRLSDLAEIEPLPYRPLKIKSGTTTDETRRIFDESMEYYIQQKYIQAISKLTVAVQKNPDSSTFHFYLGLCYLLTEQVDAALQHLEKSITLTETSNPEIVYWYLGNAWLLKEERSKALRAFEKIVASKGDYEWAARDMIAGIYELNDK